MRPHGGVRWQPISSQNAASAQCAWRAAPHDLAYQCSPVLSRRHTVVTRFIARLLFERNSANGGASSWRTTIGRRKGEIAKEQIVEDSGGSWSCCCLVATVVVVVGGGGCSRFRECPRKTSAASHHGEPTEIQWKDRAAEPEGGPGFGGFRSNHEGGFGRHEQSKEIPVGPWRGRIGAVLCVAPWPVVHLPRFRC